MGVGAACAAANRNLGFPGDGGIVGSVSKNLGIGQHWLQAFGLDGPKISAPWCHGLAMEHTTTVGFASKLSLAGERIVATIAGVLKGEIGAEDPDKLKNNFAKAWENKFDGT